MWCPRTTSALLFAWLFAWLVVVGWLGGVEWVQGNDQVRFELTFAALAPDVQCIVPWRDPAFYNKFQVRSHWQPALAAGR